MKNIPAFPVSMWEKLTDGKGNPIYVEAEYKGMTLLDYFAGQYLQGITSNDTNIYAVGELMGEENMEASEVIATMCYNVAKAMLKEREKHHD